MSYRELGLKELTELPGVRENAAALSLLPARVMMMVMMMVMLTVFMMV